MSLLLTQLIYQLKTKRWFTLLDHLEEHQTITSRELAVKTQCTERTIFSDIKEIKHYFDSSIALLGGETGYHLSFHSPVKYFEKKQALLANEPLFLLIDQLIAGTHKTNQEWADQTIARTRTE